MNMILRTGFLLIFCSSLVACHIKKPKAGLNGFNNEVSNIISNKCFSCHSGGNAEGDLGFIDNANSLISRGYVVPGNPTNSALYQKVTTPTFGARMPYGGPYLNSSEISTIASWISGLGSSGSGACIPRFVAGDPSFSIDVKPLFELNRATGLVAGNCLSCHNTSSATKSAFTSANNNAGSAEYNRIVSNAVKYPATVLVVPGDPCNSQIYRRLSQSTPPQGWASWVQMPKPWAPSPNRLFNDQELGIIYTWILNGAKNN